LASHEIGKVIKSLRELNGWTQDQLAEGITTRETVSRIERCEVLGSPYTVGFLLERLGVNPHLNGLNYLDKKRLNTQETIDELDSLLSYGNIKEAENLLKKLEADVKFRKEIGNQRYLLLAKGVIGLQKGEDLEKIFESCYKAIKLAFPDFKEEHIKNYLLMTIDLRLLCLLGTVYLQKGEVEKAMNVYQGLMENMEKRYMDKLEKGRHYPLVIFHLASAHTVNKQYQTSIDLCDKGIEVCKNTGILFFLPALTMTKVSCLFELGQIENAKKLIYEVYFTYSMFGQEDGKKIAESFAKRKLGINLSTEKCPDIIQDIHH